MRVLLIESSPGLALELEDRLTDAGHDVLTCYDEYGGPCKGVTSRERCPVEPSPHVAVLVQPEKAEPTLHEAGIVCARRRHVPVVRVDSERGADELGAPGEIEIAAAQASRRSEHAYGLVVETALHDLDALATIEQTPRRVAVRVHVPARAGRGLGRTRIA